MGSNSNGPVLSAYLDMQSWEILWFLQTRSSRLQGQNHSSYQGKMNYKINIHQLLYNNKRAYKELAHVYNDYANI